MVVVGELEVEMVVEGEDLLLVTLVATEEMVARYKHPMSIASLLSYFPLDLNMTMAHSRNKLVYL